MTLHPASEPLASPGLVACPYCSAKAGAPCTAISNPLKLTGYYHHSRHLALFHWIKQEHLKAIKKALTD